VTLIFKRFQRYFAKYDFDMSSDAYDGHFDLDLNSSLDFGSGPVPVIQSTEDGSIERCPQDNEYHPTYGTFNVERHNTSGSASQKYPLYTQVVGKDFDFDVVAYGEPAPAYDTEKTLSGYTVDVELINVGTFRDTNSTFVCSNPDPKIIQVLKDNGSKHLFATFNDTSRIDMSSHKIQTDTALRNAAFRLWSIVDKNNSIIPYDGANHPYDDDAYYQKLYDDHLKADDTTLQASGTHGFCTEETIGGSGCSSYQNPLANTSGCYACLRDFFSRPVCSRDNFAIRPAAYRVRILDNNESNDSSVTPLLLTENDEDTVEDNATLAAGYRYILEANATSYAGDTVRAFGYRQVFDNLRTSDLASILKFDDSLGCYDQNDSDWSAVFINGKLSGLNLDDHIQLSRYNLIKHSNVGQYQYRIHDNNWTLVDQKRYPYKTFPNVDDCIIDSNMIASSPKEKSGCSIDTSLTENTGVGSPAYQHLRLRYQPYSFDLSDIHFDTSPADRDLLFMTDLDDPYYQGSNALGRTMMSAVHEGNITAHAKGGFMTTNFTDGCAASDVTIVLNRISNPSEVNLSETYGVAMQQYLRYEDPNDPLKTAFDNKVNGHNANLTLAKAGFSDRAPYGSAKIAIFTTFKKPKKDDILTGEEGVNPIQTRYLEVNASSIEANATAHMLAHVPSGTKTFDRNVTYVYGKIFPQEKVYIEAVNYWKITPMYINIYCSLGSMECAQRYDLNSSSLSSLANENWYQANNLFK